MKLKGLEGHYYVGDILDVERMQIISFDDMAKAISTKRVVFIGESHENRYHHEIQLKVLGAIYKNNPRIAIGMEMFQRPFQAAIDEYIEGKIDEQTFLEKSEYFKRWKYDYNLYKGIMDFAKEKGIKILALNIKSEVIDKISEKGIVSLTEEERKEVSGIESYDVTHREFLRKIFKEHTIPEERFEFFYQAQLAWDQSMARSISEFLKKEDGSSSSIVVIAGTGHSLRFGIPDRVKRLIEGIDYSILIPEALADESLNTIEQDLADYIWFTKTALPLTP